MGEKESKAEIRWETVENNPETFEEYLEKLGINAIVLDLLEKEEEADVLIGIFNWNDRKELYECFEETGIQPIHESIENSCADIAILHSCVILNSENVLVRQIWANKSITGEELIEQYHILYSGEHELIEKDASTENTPATNNESGLYHYVAMVEDEGKIYLYDGLQPFVLVKEANKSLAEEALSFSFIEWLSIEEE